MQNLLDCPKKVKQYKTGKPDRAADGVNVIHCYILNGKETLKLTLLNYRNVRNYIFAYIAPKFK